MRISGAPSIIRKRAAISSEGVDCLHPQKRQKQFVSPIPRTGTLHLLPSNGSAGPLKDCNSIESPKGKPDSVRGLTAARVVSNPGDIDRGVIVIDDDDFEAKALFQRFSEDTSHKMTELNSDSSLPLEKQGLSGTRDLASGKKVRLGVGLIKPRFKPPVMAESMSRAPKHPDSASILPRLPRCSSTVLNCAKRVEIQKTTEDRSSSSYYCVMYCTRKLNAKHKGPWSDGVLVCRGRSCTLQDTEGKVVVKDCGHRGGDKSEGATFSIGKFDVEIMKKSTEEMFLSGKIFSETLDLDVDNIVNMGHKPSFRRPSVKHSRDGTVLPSTSPSASARLTTLHSLPKYQQTPTSGHKIATENSLVLNTKEVQRGASPVIVDPYIASKLRQHQREGVKFMYECVMGLKNSKYTGCLLADAMGLGKTLQVIALVWTLLHQCPKGRPALKRVLVICPSSLVENWGKEVRKWLGSERLNALIIHSGTPARDVKRNILDFQIGKLSPVLVTSYELLRKHNDDLRSAKPDLLVCDEAHRLKNCAGNKTIDALLALKCSMKILLTGTPVQNNLMEFYAMLDFANKDILGPLSAFKRLYADPIEKSRDRDASEEEKNLGRKRSIELMYRTRLYILQRSSDVNLMYLPVKTELVVFCKLRAPQVSLYQEFLESKTVETLFLPTSHSAVILSAIGTLRKICNHPKLVQAELRKENNHRSPEKAQDGYPQRQLRGACKTVCEGDWRLSGKLECLYKMMSALHADTQNVTKDKIVVVSNFTQTLDIIQTLCETKGWKWLRLDGTTEVSDRQSKVDRFNSDYSEERVFLLSSKAGGTGLNLIGANRLVLFDPDWNPATDAQAMARVWRDGQRKPVLIYRLLSTGSIEEKIYQRQIIKQEVAAAVGDHVQGQSVHGGRHFSREELRELFTLRLETRCDTYDLLSQSTVRQTERWSDCSGELRDYTLDEAVQTGVVTFVHKKVEKTDIDKSHCNSAGVDTPSASSEALTDKDNHEKNYSNLQSTECYPASVGFGQQSHLSNDYLPTSEDLSRFELTENEESTVCVNNYLPLSRPEPESQLFIPAEFEDHEDSVIRSHPANCSGNLENVEELNDTIEVNHDHPDNLLKEPIAVTVDDDDDKVYHDHVGNMSKDPLAMSVDDDVDQEDGVSSRRVLSIEYSIDVVTEGSRLEQCHFDRESPARGSNFDSESTCQADTHESISTDPICKSETNCRCLLGVKGHKLLGYMLETIGAMTSKLEALEVLGMPFLASLELEVELNRADFTPQKMWEGFKLFALGFLLGAKQEQIHYSCSTLGLILEKCNGDKNSSIESVFCKGLPLVRSALSRQHGHEAIELPRLLSIYENEKIFSTKPNGRFLIELAKQCNDAVQLSRP